MPLHAHLKAVWFWNFNNRWHAQWMGVRRFRDSLGFRLPICIGKFSGHSQWTLHVNCACTCTYMYTNFPSYWTATCTTLYQHAHVPWWTGTGRSQAATPAYSHSLGHHWHSSRSPAPHQPSSDLAAGSMNYWYTLTCICMALLYFTCNSVWTKPS